MTLKGRFLFVPSVGKVQNPQVFQGLHAERANHDENISSTRIERIVADGNFGLYYETDTNTFWFDYNGTWIPLPGAGVGASDEILIVADTSAGDAVVTLPDPATLPNPTTVVNVKNWRGGVNELHIQPGVGATIDQIADGIRTRSANQSFRFRYGPTADEGTVDGWVCIETAYGMDGTGGSTLPPPEGTPGLQACVVDDSTLPNWIQDPTLAADYQVLTAASGVYTKPAIPATFVAVVGFGSGGGGGGGQKNLSGDYTFGGKAGGGGARKIFIFRYADFPAVVNYTIHQGGLGGPGMVSPPDGGPGRDGQDGGPATITDPATSTVIFFVGGGKKGVGGSMISGLPGGQGGSWDIDGTTVADNINGVAGDGAGRIANDSVLLYSTPPGGPCGCAECGGGAGSGDPSVGSGICPGGGSSRHGGSGGGEGGIVGVAPLALFDGNDGGKTGTAVNGGGGKKGLHASSTPATDGAPGSGLDGGDGGGGGLPALDNADPVPLRGGNGGVPAGGGGGGGPSFSGGPSNSGSGGQGSRGELRIYVI